MPLAPSSSSTLGFTFQGFRDGWYVLWADMSVTRASMEALAFEGRVADWLINQRITPGVWAHFGRGNTGDYPAVPDDNADSLWLLLKRPADVLRVSVNFACTGITAETVFAAVSAESRIHRFIIEDICRIAHDAIRRLFLTHGDDYPLWDDLGGETRVAFMLLIKYRIARPDETVQQLHEAWVEQRRRDGWRYGARFNVDRLADPLLVPWKNLNPREQARYRLLASVIAALLPLLEA